jgi:hypothetical protein
VTDGPRAASSGITSSTLPAPAGAAKPSAIGRLIEDLPAAGEAGGGNEASNALIPFQQKSKQMLKFAAATDKAAPTSAQVIRRMPSKWPKPEWHAPWKLYRVISGHLGCALPPPPLPLSPLSLQRPSSDEPSAHATTAHSEHMPAPAALMCLDTVQYCLRWLHSSLARFEGFSFFHGFSSREAKQ